MDSRVSQVMESVMKDNGQYLGKLQPLINQKLSHSIDQCFDKNSTNADKFTNCTMQKSKKVQNIMKPFQYKLMYVGRLANQCLVKGKSVKDCQTQISKKVKQLVDNTIKQVTKI